tara:strand:+ start:401 stop:877 length:477 start_codon:yes stop_codon:yes gene_type:complete
MATYIYPAPGVTGVEALLSLQIESDGADTVLSIPSLQDVTVNASNDQFTWTQLDEASKKTIATTSTNSLSMNLVLNSTSFFGTAGTGATAPLAGIMGMSTQKDLVEFSLYMGDNSDASAGKTLTGTGYITGLAPTVSADSPVWVSPITITMDSAYTIS